MSLFKRPSPVDPLPKILFAVGCSVISAASPVEADSEPAPTPFAAWAKQGAATGDWGGLRDDLEDAGVKAELVYTTDLMAVRNGNAGSGDGFAYAGRLDAGLDFDLEKLVDMQGLSVFASAAWSSGNDLSDERVGNIFAVQQIFTGKKVRLAKLYVQQRLADDQVTLKLGRLTTEDDFLASDIYTNYVNGGINGVPSNLPDDNAGFTTAPFAQWGTVVTFAPAAMEGFRFAAGVYNADDKVNEDKRHGVDFTLDAEDGVLAIGEIGYEWKGDDGEQGGRWDNVFEEMPGAIKFGGLFQSGEREDLRSGDDKHGNYGFYFSAQQQIYREAPGSDQGLTPWAVVTWQPRNSVAELPVFFGTGLVYKGLMPTREDDDTAIGFFYGRLSSDLQPAGSEKVLEIDHTFAVTPFLYARPDLQLIFDPGGVSSADTAVAFGGEIGITF